jgi:hypothetical protein
MRATHARRPYDTNLPVGERRMPLPPSAAHLSLVRSHGYDVMDQMTYGGDLVSTWSVLRLSRESRSPVGLVNQPGNNTNAKPHQLAISA